MGMCRPGYFMPRPHCHCPKQGSILVFMASSYYLKLHDVRAACRLVGEVRELGADPLAWRRHLLEGLNLLVGTQVGMASEMPAPFDVSCLRLTLRDGIVGMASEMPALFDGRIPPPEGVLDLGWASEAERNVYLGFVNRCIIDNSRWLDDPTTCGINRLQAEGRSFTRLRQHFVDDARWSRSPYVNEERRGAGIGELLVSSRVVPRLGVGNLLVLHRGWGKPPLEEPQRRLVALVHAELGRLWEAVPVHDPMADLAPRLRQVLERLRAGDAEKQIAVRLGLSRHTVHNYVKDLHRRFEASSRGELLARCTPRAADFRPRLSRELV